MEIRLARKVAKMCNSERKMQAKLGPRNAEKLQQRLAELQAAPDLEAMKLLPAARCHELSGNRKGQIAVNLVDPKRLILVPDYDQPPTKEDGGLDWKLVTRILVLDILDYH